MVEVTGYVVLIEGLIVAWLAALDPPGSRELILSTGGVLKVLEFVFVVAFLGVGDDKLTFGEIKCNELPTPDAFKGVLPRIFGNCLPI